MTHQTAEEVAREGKVVWEYERHQTEFILFRQFDIDIRQS